MRFLGGGNLENVGENVGNTFNNIKENRSLTLTILITRGIKWNHSTMLAFNSPQDTEVFTEKKNHKTILNYLHD